MLPTNKTENTENPVMTDMLIVLLVLAAVAVYYYRMRGAIVIILSAGTCCLTDVICLHLRSKKRSRERDVSALVTGLTLGLMMSASVPYFAAVTASVFAIVLAKHAFGGHGCEIFSPAAAGFLFTALCFPESMLLYPRPLSSTPVSPMVSESLLSQSMTKTFLLTESSSVSAMDVLIGKFSGPMGTGFMVLLIVAAAFLLFRRSISAVAFFAELLSAGIAALIHYGFDPMALLYFFSGGMFLFGIIFLSCDNITMPKTKSSRLVYGIVTGVLTALFQFYASAENAVVYAVILAAPIGIELNRRSLSFAWMLSKRGAAFSEISKTIKHVTETIELLNGKNHNDNEKKEKKEVKKNNEKKKNTEKKENKKNNGKKKKKK